MGQLTAVPPMVPTSPGLLTDTRHLLSSRHLPTTATSTGEPFPPRHPSPPADLTVLPQPLLFVLCHQQPCFGSPDLPPPAPVLTPTLHFPLHCHPHRQGRGPLSVWLTDASPAAGPALAGVCTLLNRAVATRGAVGRPCCRLPLLPHLPAADARPLPSLMLLSQRVQLPLAFAPLCPSHQASPSALQTPGHSSRKPPESLWLVCPPHQRAAS